MWSDLLEIGNRPDQTQAKVLKENFEKQCQKAAEALAGADVLLLVTGAGFSADSGLAVYGDVAKVPAYQMRDLDYSDICMPDWLYDDPELFYGFWGQCFNDYRTTQPHEGYDILARWKEDKNKADDYISPSTVAQEIQTLIARKVELMRQPFDTNENNIIQQQLQHQQLLNKQRYTPYDVDNGKHAGAFFSFTSNVDAHFHDTFEAHEIRECHGNIETWQCSDPYCPSGIWRAPLDHSFVVDTETMLAPPIVEEKQKNANKAADAAAAAAAVCACHSTVDDVPHIGHTAATGLRRNPLKYMPPGKDTKGWLNKIIKITDNSSSNNNGNDNDDKNSNCDNNSNCNDHNENSSSSNHEKDGNNDSIENSNVNSNNNSGSDLTEKISNWPKCGHCRGLARPAILMFGDFQWKRDMLQSERWNLWTETVLEMCEKGLDSKKAPLKVCILEVGCGLNVPTCRSASERMVAGVKQRGGHVTLVRVNPDLPLSSDPAVAECLIPIMSRGLQAIRQIDKLYRGIS